MSSTPPSFNNPKTPPASSSAKASGPKKKFNLRSPQGAVLLVVGVLLGVFAIKGLQTGFMIYMMMSHPRPAAVISSVTAQKVVWPETITAVTELKAVSGALLKAQLAGEVKELSVLPNQQVKKGDLLLVIDSQAEHAAAQLAKINLDRARELRAQSVNTQNDLDTAEANYNQTMAALNKKEIRAPFDGVVGVPQVFVGQYLKIGDPLISIEDRQTMNADFGVAQSDVQRLKIGAPVELTVNAYPAEVFKGKVVGIDPRVDEQTLNVSVRAVFENPDGKILSGMFGSATVILNEKKEAISVPTMAVVYSAYGNFVYVLKDEVNEKTKQKERVATQTFVKIGSAKGDYSAITSGLKAGDEVVVAGQIKLHNGSAVSVDNKDLPKFSETPTPTES